MDHTNATLPLKADIPTAEWGEWLIKAQISGLLQVLLQIKEVLCDGTYVLGAAKTFPRLCAERTTWRNAEWSCFSRRTWRSSGRFPLTS